MPRAPFVCLLPLLIGLATLWPADAGAQVRRCTGPDGAMIFTDRRCNDIGATERLPRDNAVAGSSRIYRNGCSRNLQDLIYEITSAIDNHDVNRLAGVYHWGGMGTKSGYALLDRLAAVARRPLVDIVPLMPAAPAVERVTPDGEALLPSVGDPTLGDKALGYKAPGETAAGNPGLGDLYPQSTVRRAPVGLRLEQTLSNGSTPSRTTFGLRRHLGCLWVTF